MHCINPRLPGWMSVDELVWLHAQAIHASSVVEIGSWKGRSTYALLTGCLGSVYAVDHFKGSPSELETNHSEALTRDIFADFMANVGYFHNLRVMRMTSADAAQNFVDEDIFAEMIFIDGEHTKESVLNDLKLWMPRCSKLLCGHDVNFDGVRDALAELSIHTHQGPGSIWYAKRGEDYV